MSEEQKAGGIYLILPEIKDLLGRRKDPQEIREALEEFEPADIAEIVSELEPQEQAYLFSLLSTEFAGEVFEDMPHPEQVAVLDLVGPGKSRAILEEVEPDDRADFLELLPREKVDRFLAIMEKRDAVETSELLSYPSNSAGGLMTTRYLEVKQEATVADALAYIRREGEEIEEIYHLYVTDQEGKLAGTISLRDLVLAAPDKTIAEIMVPNPIRVRVDSDQEEVAGEIKKYDLVSVPVVDEQERLKGVISVDDVIDVITEEQTEDVYKMGAATTISIPDYSLQNSLGIVKHRITWLILLVVMGFFAGFLIERYESLMQSFVALAFFIPMLMDGAGNAGTQASTVVVRGLATGEVRMRDFWRVVSKEMLAGIIAGLIIGVLSITRVFALRQGIELALVVSLAMMLTITMAMTIGAAIPLFCKRAGVDPAVVSSPLITTVLDISAIFIYFELARFFLNLV